MPISAQVAYEVIFNVEKASTYSHASSREWRNRSDADDRLVYAHVSIINDVCCPQGCCMVMTTINTQIKLFVWFCRTDAIERISL